MHKKRIRVLKENWALYLGDKSVSHCSELDQITKKMSVDLNKSGSTMAVIQTKQIELKFNVTH